MKFSPVYAVFHGFLDFCLETAWQHTHDQFSRFCYEQPGDYEYLPDDAILNLYGLIIFFSVL